MAAQQDRAEACDARRGRRARTRRGSARRRAKRGKNATAAVPSALQVQPLAEVHGRQVGSELAHCPSPRGGPAQRLHEHHEPEQVAALGQSDDLLCQLVQLGFGRPALREHRVAERSLAELVRASRTWSIGGASSSPAGVSVPASAQVRAKPRLEQARAEIRRVRTRWRPGGPVTSPSAPRSARSRGRAVGR